MELTAAALFFVGFAGGLVNVPLYSYLQYRSPVEKRGSILAANNFPRVSRHDLRHRRLLSAAAPDIFENRRPLFSPRGCSCSPPRFAADGVLRLQADPGFTLRFLFATFFRCFYKIRAHGRHNLPEHSGALLVANHLSWLDGC